MTDNISPESNPDCSEETTASETCGLSLKTELIENPITPENLKADLVNRFFASLVDGLIALGFAIPSIIFYGIGLYRLYNDIENDSILFFLIAGLLYLIPLTYSLIKDGLGKGQSWGKKPFEIKVVHLPDNTPCTFGQSFTRNIIMTLVTCIPYVGWLIEPVFVLATKDGRRLGDKAANTQVINVAKQKKS